MHHPTDRIIHTTAFVSPVVEHWLDREIANKESIWHPTADTTTDFHLGSYKLIFQAF